MYYINIALCLLILWHKDKCPSKLFLAGVMAGVSTSVKLDATGYALVLTLVLLFILFSTNSTTLNQKIKEFFIFTIPCYSILIFFNIYKILVVVPRAPQPIGDKMNFDLYSIKLQFGLVTISRFKTVMINVFENLFMSGNWNIIWLIFLISTLNLRKQSKSFEIKILFVALITYFGLQTAGYTFTQYYYWIADTNTSLSRHLLSHYPVVVALIVFLNGQEKNHRSLRLNKH